MRVFASWSGERSRTVAQGLRSFLQDVLPDVEVFISENINPGEAWAQRLGTELENSSFGVLCLTEENFQAPWLLFEAGAISKKFGAARVAPYLVDELPAAAERSPLAQFQHVRADRNGTLRLAKSINELREKPQPSDRLERSFDRWWPDLEGTLNSLLAESKPSPVSRSDRELLETILRRVESLTSLQTETLRTRLSLTAAEIGHLQRLRDQPATTYSRSSALQKELRRLRDSGLIKNKAPIADLPASFALNQFFELLGKGSEYLNELGTVTATGPAGQM